ncbi:TetR/AcrR family transcriptional regulator [Subsaxibacter sp. CAU 1640]|uniref:TetR/AcrR family transcriptional regulator n=1 Tax=Subsaxibacter sp. CAU 1640 TaxID=2933271 RepID=UPI002006B6B7|nr:TetR/AcrR family transcriptional regulator [Subsaxibacter sp. CAU 1640]MCK7591064.1 TetR/AcrR family transcriptional regulator [Subsaxibacter sp. CAU 1640]
MPKDGQLTKDRILAESRSLVLKNGFAATSIDNILEKTGLTKGAFFYHFKSKSELAKALIEDFAGEDISYMNKALDKTATINEKDALERLLQFIQEFIDMMADLSDPPPGCLYASYLNETNQFDEDIRSYITSTILLWRQTLELLIGNVLEQRKMSIEVDSKSLADMLVVIFEGSYVVSKAVNEADLTAKQLTHLKNYYQLLFKEKK